MVANLVVSSKLSCDEIKFEIFLLYLTTCVKQTSRHWISIFSVCIPHCYCSLSLSYIYESQGPPAVQRLFQQNGSIRCLTYILFSVAPTTIIGICFVTFRSIDSNDSLQWNDSLLVEAFTSFFFKKLIFTSKPVWLKMRGTTFTATFSISLSTEI